MKTFLICVLVMMLGFIAVGNAQEKPEKPSPEAMQKQMEAAFSAMAPMMGNMMEAMIEAQLSVISKPESAEKMATYVKNFYEALLKRGFSKDEAFKIVTSVSIPSASLSTK